MFQRSTILLVASHKYSNFYVLSPPPLFLIDHYVCYPRGYRALYLLVLLRIPLKCSPKGVAQEE